jgi:hypothetical protein
VNTVRAHYMPLDADGDEQMEEMDDVSETSNSGGASDAVETSAMSDARMFAVTLMYDYFIHVFLVMRQHVHAAELRNAMRNELCGPNSSVGFYAFCALHFNHGWPGLVTAFAPYIDHLHGHSPVDSDRSAVTHTQLRSLAISYWGDLLTSPNDEAWDRMVAAGDGAIHMTAQEALDSD